MTLGEMLTDLTARIGSTPEVSNSDMTLWINEGMRMFCNEYNYTWLSKRVTSSTFANQEEYTLPADYKLMIELRIDPTSTDPSVYKYYPWQQRYTAPSGEKSVSVLGSIMRVTPTPTTTGSSNIYLSYVRYATNMTAQSDSPSDTDIAGMPETYHPAIIQYAYGIYQSYDEEQSEFESVMGSPTNPIPGTYYYFVKRAIEEDGKQKMGLQNKMISLQQASGYTLPNRTGSVSAVLGV